MIYPPFEKEDTIQPIVLVQMAKNNTTNFHLPDLKGPSRMSIVDDTAMAQGPCFRRPSQGPLAQPMMAGRRG